MESLTMTARSTLTLSAAVVAFAACVGIVAARQPAPDVPAKQAPSADQPAGQPGARGPGERGPGERGRGRPAEGPVNVEAAMKGMARAMKQLAPQIADASKKDENLKLINDMQRACVAAKGAPVPDGVLSRAKDDAERAKWATEYRKDLLASVRVMLDIEQDLLDGKGQDAKVKLDQIIKLRDGSHNLMGVR
jgi:hypothetical protein